MSENSSVLDPEARADLQQACEESGIDCYWCRWLCPTSQAKAHDSLPAAFSRAGHVNLPERPVPPPEADGAMLVPMIRDHWQRRVEPALRVVSEQASSGFAGEIRELVTSLTEHEAHAEPLFDYATKLSTSTVRDAQMPHLRRRLALEHSELGAEVHALDMMLHASESKALHPMFRTLAFEVHHHILLEYTYLFPWITRRERQFRDSKNGEPW